MKNTSSPKKNLTVLPFDVWDILVVEQPSSIEWHIAICSRSALS
jgi:hypothetical protein